jgi:hypothetical protein
MNMHERRVVIYDDRFDGRTVRFPVAINGAPTGEICTALQTRKKPKTPTIYGTKGLPFSFGKYILRNLNNPAYPASLQWLSRVITFVTIPFLSFREQLCA